MRVVAQRRILNRIESCSGHTQATLPPTVDAQFEVNNFQTATLLTCIHETNIPEFAVFSVSILGQSQRQ